MTLKTHTSMQKQLSLWAKLLVFIVLLAGMLSSSQPQVLPQIVRLSEDEQLQLPIEEAARRLSPVFSGLSNANQKPLQTPAAAVTISTGTVLLGEDFTITATFQNNGNSSDWGSTGYGPFIDLYIPHKGEDGVFPNEGTYDGISPAAGTDYSASQDGEALTVVTQTFPASGCVDHPWAVDEFGVFIEVCGTPGDQLVSIELPYGSYTTGQPQLSVTIPARLSADANFGTPLTIRGRGGFIYGATPMVDWCCTMPVDTTLLSDSGSPSTWAPFSDVNPQVLTFSKSTSAGEVATGPNNPATFTLSIDLAPGQSFRDIQIRDTLPNNLVYLGNLTTNPPADAVTQPTIDGLPHNGDEIILAWDGPLNSSVTSTITASFDYYIPELDADGDPIAPGTTTNQAVLDQIWWTPADGSPEVQLSGTVGPRTASTSDQPITLGKGSSIAVDNGPAGYTPGDVILFSLTFEVSDYFGFDNLSLVDTLPDGLHFHPSIDPTLRIIRDGATENYTFASGNVEVECNYSGGTKTECDQTTGPGSPGETTITFDIDQELADQGVSSQVLGDLVDDGGSPANATTTGTVQFYAVMLDKYTDIHPAPEDYLKMGDEMSNSAEITGTQVDPDTCSPECAITAVVSGNAASTAITIGRGGLDKSIVGVNGAFCNGGAPCSSVSIAAGDTVTYRILYDLLTGDYDDLIFTDYLPLPIFYAEDPNNDGSSLSTWPEDVDLGDPVPAPGTWELGANDTRGVAPSVSISPHDVDNYVRFSFGDYDDPTNAGATIEILFTVRVTDIRFGDGLRMRNSVLQQDANSPGSVSTSTTDVDLTLTEPVLVGRKSVVSTDHVGITPDPAIAAPIVFEVPGNPASDPWNTGSTISSDYLDANGLNSGIDGIDGGDLVKFALVIENTGSGINGAYDIAIKDTLPAGYIFPGIGLGGFNLQVYRGDGFALDDGTGAGLEYLGTSGDATDFFDNGIRLEDPADNPAFDPADPEYGEGLCQAHDATNGKNIIIVTYDLLVDPNVSPGTVIRNIGEILGYSGEDDGDNYLPGPDDNPQDSTLDVPDLAKTRTGTELIEVNNNDNQVVIGEEIYYQLVITFPEGSSPNTVITDSLDSGLGYVEQTGFTISNEDTGDPDGGISFTGSSVPVSSNGGRTITWDLGTVTNSNDDNSIPETITITYTVQTLNTAGNQHGLGVNNAVEIHWDALDSEGDTVRLSEGPISSSPATVVEPSIQTNKSVVVGGSGTTGDAGDSVVYTITFTSNASRPTAYEAELSDFLPDDFDYSSDPSYGITGVTDSASVLTTTDFEITAGDELRLTRTVPSVPETIDMPPGRSVTVTLTGELEDTVYTGQTITNNAVMTWSSQSGDNNSGAEYGERDGSNGIGGLNDYESIGTVDIDIYAPSPGKTVDATSEAHSGTISGIPRLVIGEIIRYRIEVRLAEGTNNDLILRDQLPGRLVFLNDDTATVAFVADDPTDISSTTTADLDVPGISDPGAYFSGNESNLSTINPTVLLDDGNISASLSSNTDNYGSGTDIYFKLGDVFNGEEDDNSEFAVVEFNVLVMNHSGNLSGRSRYNSFSVYVDEDGDGDTQSDELIETSGSTRIITVEPEMRVTKSIATPPNDAGDEIIYQLVIENRETGNNDATGFDLVFTDTFDAYIEGLAIDSLATTQGGTCLGNGAGTTAYADDGGSLSGQDFTLTATCLDAGESITILISGTLADDVPAGYVLDNTGYLTWTSLPGDKGTSPNPTSSDVNDDARTDDESGEARGERNGSGTPALNDYANSGFADITLDVPVPTKSIVSTSVGHTSEAGDGSSGNPRDLAIGEIIRYRLAISLPEGTNTNLTLEDILPAGFSYVDDSTVQVSFLADLDITEAADLALADNDALPPTFTLPASRITVSGQQVTFDLGTLVNNDINDGNTEYAVIDFDVLVNNDADNNNTDLDNNDFEVYLDGALAGTSNQVQTRIVEPVLDLAKTASTTTPAYEETFSYDLVITHDPGSLADAFDLVVIDRIPSGLSYVPGSAGPSSWSPAFDGTDTITWTCTGGCSLPLAGSATLTYDVTMASPPAPPAVGDNLVNNANLTWTSLDGADSGERTGDDNGGAEPYNDYLTTITETVVLSNPELRISKDNGVGNYIPGESVVYTIVVENIGNVGVSDALVSDAFPGPGMLDSWDWVCAGSTGGALGCSESIDLVGDFSDLVDLPAGSSLTYQVTADILSSAEGNLVNTATVSMPSGVIEPSPDDNSATDIDGQESHADLSVTKDNGATILSPGGETTYTVVVANNSPSDVTGALVEDLLPPEIDSWTWDCQPIIPPNAASGCDGVLDSTADFTDSVNLPAGSSITYLITAQISAAASGSLTNTVTIDVPAGVIEDNPADNTATDEDYFPGNFKSLESAFHNATTLPDAAIGEILTYQVSLTVPVGAMTNLHLIDTLDPGLAFVTCESIAPAAPGLSTTAAGGFAGVCSSPAVSELPVGSASAADQARLVDYDFGTLANTSGGEIDLLVRYQVVVLDSLNNQSDSTPPLGNLAEWVWDDGNLIDNAEVVTILEPDLTLTKGASPLALFPGQVTTFTVTIAHSGESQTSAFDVVLTDVLPEDMIYQAPIRHISGQVPTTIDDSGDPTLIITWDEFLNDGTDSVFEIDAMLDPDFRRRNVDQTLTNEASLAWTSLPDDYSTPQSIYNPLSTERFYDPLSDVNIYNVEAEAAIRIPSLPDTGFAPGRVTTLSAQPPDQAYGNLSGLRLEIPRLGIEQPIVSVPLTDEGYNLDWLWNQAGWLEGTAYPTWTGNTVITGHAYLPSGFPGSFVNLRQLGWGDEIIIYAHGMKYTYQVREKDLVTGDDLSILGHRKTDWLTLFTCQSYSEELESYRWRQVVGAALVRVERLP